ncbi:MAG: N-6 DNA methylase [Defluviitaleaceae bacterium]|nr:N-6 DNA methylase [Defluviitaleaceae bacterium]
MISKATKRNWDRLNVSDNHSKLTTRANKINSKKRILPLEYFSNIKNLAVIETLLNEIKLYDGDIFNAMYTIVINYFNTLGLMHKTNVQCFLLEYSNHTLNPQLLSFPLPMDESDLLGLLYQSLHLEGDKNKQGLYYTPANTAKQLNKTLDFSLGQNFLDPCCGSGSFLINTSAHPTQLYGIDCDPIAVMLCKANLIMHFKDIDFTPNVYCADFLAQHAPLTSMSFDYVSTNPPWGAVARNTYSSLGSGESFALFLYKSLEVLKDGGVLNFLLPESILNVKAHTHLRQKLLQQYSITNIQLFSNFFTGVTTKTVALTVLNKKTKDDISIFDGKKQFKVSPSMYIKTANYTFSFIETTDKEILDKLYKKGQFYLSNSTWALGIVTGNNAEKLLDTPSKETEPIYTGKEICAFKLLRPQKHIIYDRSQLQQVAKEEIYRAKEKLVYKFISKKLVFAYDGNGQLFLNSANILIPNIPHMSIQTVLLFLNSELFQFAYMKQFGEIKILKGNLNDLPFPHLTPKEDEAFTAIAKKIIDGCINSLSVAQKMIFDYYALSSKQINHIEEFLCNG